MEQTLHSPQFKALILTMLLALFGCSMGPRSVGSSASSHPSGPEDQDETAFLDVRSTATPSTTPSDEVESPYRAADLGPIPAFPGAQGFGASAAGGRGGRVIEVTNLNSRGEGSLRAALEAEGPRIVVFRVGGIIELDSGITIRHPYLTVAGQTAPGGGITIKGLDENAIVINGDAHDIVIRYLRIRHGDEAGSDDNLTIHGGHDIILDHVSLSWSTDENLGIWHSGNRDPIYNITVQRSIMAEGLSGHSNGMHISGAQDYSLEEPVEAWRELRDLTIHHNLFIHNSHRNPRVLSAGAQVINNVVYNWKARIGSTMSGTVIDYINNYYNAGPMSNLDRLLLHEDFSPDHPGWQTPLPNPSIYIAGNVVQPNHPDPQEDNWGLLAYNWTYAPLPETFRRHVPLSQAAIPVGVQPAREANRSVIADVGANARLDCSGNWVPNSDAVDLRLLADVASGTGPVEPISGPQEVGGYPEIDQGTPCADSDHDGMPDAWERRHCFDPYDPSDGSEDADGDGFTAVEAYLNGTDPVSGPSCHWRFLPQIVK